MKGRRSEVGGSEGQSLEGRSSKGRKQAVVVNGSLLTIILIPQVNPAVSSPLSLGQPSSLLTIIIKSTQQSPHHYPQVNPAVFSPLSSGKPSSLLTIILRLTQQSPHHYPQVIPAISSPLSLS